MIGAIQVNIERLDIVVIVLYLIGIVGLGCWAGFRQRRGEEGKGYFLAGGTLTWPIIGLALFSTNISTIHLVSQAQVGYTDGLAYGNFEWMAPFLLIVLALFFAPFYIRARVATLPDFLEKRYSRSCRDWLALLSILSAILIHIGFSLYTGAVVLEGMFGVSVMHSIIVVACLTGLYTIIGGLMAVVVTESIQTLILLAGAICITVVAYGRIGGWEGLATSVEPIQLTMFRTKAELPDLPWYSVLLGYPVIGLWYWCADQTIVQRVLGAKDENHARLGPLFAGFIKILPVFIFILPGTLCLGLINRGNMKHLPIQPIALQSETSPVLEADAQVVYETIMNDFEKHKRSTRVETLALNTDLAPERVKTIVQDLVDTKMIRVRTEDTYAELITQLLPPGLRGLMAAALLAALMSTVSGALNSIATLFSYDIYKRWRPDTPDHKLVRIGRLATFAAMILAILWSPYIAHYENIYKGISTLISYVSPPIAAVFLWGVLWRRASAAAALTTLLFGSFLGAVVFFIDWNKATPWMQSIIDWKISFMMGGFYLFVICSVVLAVVSLIKPAPASAEIDALVWRNPWDALRGPAWRGVWNYKLWAVVLFFTMIMLYIIFARRWFI